VAFGVYYEWLHYSQTTGTTDGVPNWPQVSGNPFTDWGYELTAWSSGRCREATRPLCEAAPAEGTGINYRDARYRDYERASAIRDYRGGGRRAKA
jgi:hypothetical protein